jgi:hypothetical protein
MTLCDVFAPARSGVPARGQTVSDRTRDGRCRIVVGHVAVEGHVQGLPVGRSRQRGRLGQPAETEPGAVLVDEPDDLGRKVASNRAPTRARGAVADAGCRGLVASAAAQGDQHER